MLPPADMAVVECEFNEEERDFYDALYTKSKRKFDSFLEAGKVLHNYASILELLLRLRQVRFRTVRSDHLAHFIRKPTFLS